MDSLETKESDERNVSYHYKESNHSFFQHHNLSLINQNQTPTQEILTTLPEYYAHTLVYIWVAPFLIFIGTVGKFLEYFYQKLLPSQLMVGDSKRSYLKES